MQDEYLVAQWNSRTCDSNSMHKICVEAAEDKRFSRDPLPTAAELEWLQADEVTQRLVMTMPLIDKGKLGHRAFERKVSLLHLKFSNGVGAVDRD